MGLLCKCGVHLEKVSKILKILAYFLLEDYACKVKHSIIYWHVKDIL